MKKRYYFMNLLRFLSMVAIVFYHMVFTLYIYGIRQLSSISMLFSNANMHIAKVGVSLFFILSGCGLMLSASDSEFNVKEFYKKRFFKILIPFYIVYVLYFVFLAIIGQISITNPFDGRNVTPFNFIFTLLGMDAYLDSFGIPTCSLGIGEWFLGCLILMYIIFPLLRKVIIKRPYMTLLVATLYFMLIINRYYRFPRWENVPMYTNFALKIYDFIIGMFLARVIDKLPKWSFIVGLIVNLFFVFCPVELPGIDNFQIIIHSVSAFLAFCGIEAFLSKREKFNSVISKLCEYSYEYFLIHHIVILYMSKKAINVEFSNFDVLVLFLTEIAVTVALSYCLKLLENIKSIIKKKV